MRRIWMLFTVAAVMFNMMACAASSQSSIGANCNFDGRPVWEMPLVCQGR